MAYSNSSHFSDNYRHLICIICICKIKDTIDTRLTYFLEKEKKGKRMALQLWGFEVGPARGRSKSKGPNHWAGLGFVK